ncbi:membrane protein [Fusobacterium necrophorum BFTR-2]|nr:putative sulfate exporter family transporter [Fusobacterium necrophorum]KDE73070.1 membrane protein [Fusobacterium necrophorum BFTR-2]
MNLQKILPGLFLSILLAIVSQCLVKLPAFSTLGAALIAILLGMLLGNTLCKGSRYEEGTKFSEKRLLEYSIVLNGLILDIVIMKEVGIQGVIFIVCQMVLTIVAAYVISRKFGFGKKFSLMMGAGNAVCGSSAIGTVAPILEADSKDKGISITCVNILGTVLMIFLPVLASILYASETLPTSALIGGTVQSVGQVIASAKLVNDSVVEMATIFKLIRVLLLVGIALSFERLNLEVGKHLFSPKVKKKEKRTKVGIPWFILAFLFCFILRSTGYVPSFILLWAKKISTQFEIIALAAIGLRVKFSDILKEGVQALTASLLIGVCQILFALTLMKIFFY